MRKIVPMSSARLYRGPAARPVFLTRRPTFRTRRDWSPLLWALAALGLAGAAFLGAVWCLL